MNKGLLAFTALVALVLALPLAAHAKIEITGAALVTAQDVDFDTTKGNLDEDFNFNDPRINLYVNGDVSDKISVTAKFWASNDWSHENQRGGQNQLGGAIPNGAAATADANGVAIASLGNGGSLNDAVEMIRAYVTLKDVAGSGFDLKVGTIDIPYGYEYAMRTANGDNMKNDFLTNSLLDINGGDEGISLSGSFDMGSTSTPLAWEIALLNGGAVTDGNPSGANSIRRSNDDLSWAIRAEVGLQENLTLQASYYTSDNKKDGDQDPLNVGSSFLVSNINSTLMAGAGGTGNSNLAGLVVTTDQTGVAYKRDMWEVSGKYDYGQGYVLAFWGNIDAKADSSAAILNANGVSNNPKYDYYGAQGRYNFDENSYLAVRWNRLDPNYTVAGFTNNLGQPDMWTVAAGYKLADNAMVKAEWSKFDEGGGGLSNGNGPSNDNQKADADALTVGLGVSF